MSTKEKKAARPEWGPREELRLINSDVPRVDGPEKVTGIAKYAYDMKLPGMLYARVLCCPYPVAHPTIDLEPALAIEGVHDAMEIKDSRPEGWTRYMGQPIAAVAAETPELAEDALRALDVHYEPGEWAVSFEQSTADDAPDVTGRGTVRPGRDRGDEEAARIALDESDEIVEATYTIPVQFHACLETHGVVVDFRGGDEATIYASTQATHGIAGEAAQILGLPANAVTNITDYMGGGFGAKFSLDRPGQIACQLAKRLGRPIHLLLKRADEFHCAGNRSGSYQVLEGGATKDGRFKALVAHVGTMGGLGRGSNPGQPYIYDVQHAYSKSTAYHTNTDGSRAMRAPGHPQASFAIESMIDELAYAVKHDPLEFRKKNLSSEVYHRQLDRVAKEIGWPEHPNKIGPPKELPELAVGIGFGVATWGSGGRPTCQVDVKIEQDGSVTSTVGTQDLGTGTRTYVASIVAEELGLGMDGVEARIGSSKYGASVGSGGSVTVPSLAPAVKDAAHNAREAFAEHLAELMTSDPADIVFEGGQVIDSEQSDKRMTWKEACATLPPAGLERRGVFQGHLTGAGVHGAQAAKVEVDTLTGELHVLKMVAVQDCGLVLNRLATRSQVNGALIQALSYGMFEERIIDPWLGLGMNNSFEEYRIAGTRDMPELVSILDDDDTRQETLGIGEPPVIPGQSAIANAIFNACGVRVRDLPLTRDKIINALAERG